MFYTTTNSYILAYFEILKKLMQAVLGPWRGVLFRPVPVVHVGGVGPLLHNPARISFSPLGHRFLTVELYETVFNFMKRWKMLVYF